jgi:hypothetical protein
MEGAPLPPGENLDLDWSRVPPEPKDGLRAIVRRRPELS